MDAFSGETALESLGKTVIQLLLPAPLAVRLAKKLSELQGSFKTEEMALQERKRFLVHGNPTSDTATSYNAAHEDLERRRKRLKLQPLLRLFIETGLSTDTAVLLSKL